MTSRTRYPRSLTWALLGGAIHWAGCHHDQGESPLEKTDAGVKEQRDAAPAPPDARPELVEDPGISNATVVTSAQDLPPCDAEHERWVAISEDGQTLSECRAGAWEDVNRSEGQKLIRVDVEAKGEHCPGGGFAINEGLDRDQSGTLEGAEVTATHYACSTPKPRPDYMVDILLVIDNSISMKEEQSNLAQELPIMVDALAHGRPKVGGRDMPLSPVQSVHVGVVTSDMGVNGVVGIDGCKDLGQDGRLQTAGNLSMGTLTEHCDANQTKAVDGSYLTYEAATTAPLALSSDAACITQQGTSGCGFEQQLEAMWKALAPSTDVSFASATSGHGDKENAGFLRKDSVLVVIAVTDEEDCSIPDSERDIFAPTPSSPKFRRPDGSIEGVNSRCALHATDGTLHPIARYIDGLKNLRPEHPDRVIFGALVGTPLSASNLVTADGTQDFEAILALPQMGISFNTADPVLLRSASGAVPDPACASVNGVASPARRFVQVAQGFGKSGLVHSICSESFNGFTEALLEKIALLQ